MGLLNEIRTLDGAYIVPGHECPLAPGRSKCKSLLEEGAPNLGPLDSHRLSLTKYELKTPKYKIYKPTSDHGQQQSRPGHPR